MMKKRFPVIMPAIIILICMLPCVSFAARMMNVGTDCIEVGDTVSFGYYNVQPLKWVVIGKDNDSKGLLLLAKDGLKRAKFSENDSSNWEDSPIRFDLNNSGSGFVGTAFGTEESSAIRTTSVLTKTWNGEVRTTDDKLFLLSKSEAENVAQSIRKINHMWWLRTPGDRENVVTYVGQNGAIKEDGTSVGNQFYVRPAFWLSTENVLFASAAEGLTPGEIGEYSGNAWKLTLKSNTTFPISWTIRSFDT